jgi:hypothetical protein
LASESPQVSDRTKVESSSIASIGYTRSTSALEIEFRSGAIYRYRDVPITAFKEFMKAESKGRFFAAQIRGKYAYEKIRGQRE